MRYNPIKCRKCISANRANLSPTVCAARFAIEVKQPSVDANVAHMRTRFARFSRLFETHNTN